MKIVAIIKSPCWFKSVRYKNELYLSEALPDQEKVKIFEEWLKGCKEKTTIT